VNAGPLAGVRVLEVGTMLAGPYATMMLADLGSEVTKIEPPGGEISRQVGDTYFASLNRGKKSVCLDLTTGDGLDGGDDPAFDYLIQAATGVAALTGDPDAPPTLPGYSSADNSAGLTAALGLLAMIVAGRGGQVDISMRDVMLSQLNYRASAYLNAGTEPVRLPAGARSGCRQPSFGPSRKP
jgi:CoA:oxalate CoA-transferase